MLLCTLHDRIASLGESLICAYISKKVDERQ